jgi:ferredoxin-NADP reductase
VGLKTIEVRVEEIRDSAAGVRELTLVPCSGDHLPTFSPGSHVIVHLPGDPQVRNAYSLASAPWQQTSYRIAIRRVDTGRGGSRHLHEEVSVGDLLAIEHPRNHFLLPARAGRLLLVAGGIGITPFVSWVHQLHADGTPFELLYAGRGDGSERILDELRGQPTGSIRTFSNRFELMAAISEALGCQPLDTHLAICGPSAMMDAVVEAADAAGWPAERVHLERFVAEGGAMEPFRVVLGADRREIEVTAEQTLLEALEQAQVNVPYQCRRGVCGECLTGVLEGDPDHRDVFLSPEEREDGNKILPCVSRCALGATLVLDLP